MPTSHPGEFLLEEFMKPHGLSIYKTAHLLEVPESRISRILHGEGRITTDLAYKLSALFGMNPDSWMRLQMDYDLEHDKPSASELKRVEKRRLALA